MRVAPIRVVRLMAAEATGYRIPGIFWVGYANKNLSVLRAIGVERVSDGPLLMSFVEPGCKVNEINVSPGRAEGIDDFTCAIPR